MRSKTRIVVLHMKEVIYTTIFIILGIVLIFLLVYMFGPSRHNKTDTGQPRYKAGVYTSSIQFEGQNLDVQVVVDENHINSVSFVNLNDTVTTMYPLMQSSMDNIPLTAAAMYSPLLWPMIRSGFSPRSSSVRPRE